VPGGLQHIGRARSKSGCESQLLCKHPSSAAAAANEAIKVARAAIELLLPNETQFTALFIELTCFICTLLLSTISVEHRKSLY